MNRRAFLTGVMAIAAAPSIPVEPAPKVAAIQASPLPGKVFIPNCILGGYGPGMAYWTAAAQRDLNEWHSEQLAQMEIFRGERWSDEDIAKMRSRRLAGQEA